MPEEKPVFDPNKPYQAPESQVGSKPPFNPTVEYKPVKSFVPHIDDFMPVPNDNADKVESAIDFLDKNPTTKGGLIDVDKDILRDVMKHPNVTQNQIKEAIGTMQSGNLYYLKNENGVMIPKQLKNGERPPKGYNVQSVWGTQNDANDDAWYTDLGKSLYNGVIGAAKGVVDLAQTGTMLATGEESNYLNKLSNTAEALQTQKDADLNKPIYNTEGVKQWSDLLDKDRFDLSPSALWGTMNMAAESITSFYGGAKAATSLAKLGPKASAYVGSYLTQLGDNLDNAKEAGLEGREAASFATLTTSIQAAIDAQFGLESKIYQNNLKKPAADLFKSIAATIPKDVDGKITQEGFKQLAQEATEGYGKLAAIGSKAIGKDALTEGAQETGQDFVAKSAENLWDKMDINERHKFGTEINSPESFASYIQNGLSGLVAGAPMALASTNAKKKYNEQSASAFKTIQKGPEAVKELKNNLLVAKEKGNISIPQYEQAVFKIDAYDKYNEQTKDVELDEKQKKEAFELSFNIEALKSEIKGISSEDMEKLDPIGQAKINNKKTLINGLQKELDAILIKSDIQTETKVGQDTVDKVAKAEEPKEDQATVKSLIKKFGPPAPPKTEPVKTDVGVVNKRRANNPKFDEVDAAGNPKFNTLRPLEKKEVLHDYFDAHPELNNELDVKIEGGQNNVWSVNLGKDRYIKFARSVVPDDYTGEVNNFPSNEKRRNIGDNAGRPHYIYDEPVGLRLEDIKSDTLPSGRKRVINIYNKQTGKHIAFGKELEKGSSEYSPFEIKQLEDIISRDNTKPITLQEVKPKTEKVQKKKELNPIDKETEERDLAQNRELSSEEVVSELEKEFAREETFAETGMFEDTVKENEIVYDNSEIVKLLKAARKKGIKDVLGQLASRITDKSVKAAVDVMLKNSDKIDHFVKFYGFDKMAMGGLYRYQSGDISLGSHLETEVDEQLFIKIIAHEYMHAFTTKALANPKTDSEKEFYKDISKIYREVKEKTNYPELYGFTNIYEFVSELATNSSFLKDIKDNKRTTFQKIIDAIKKLFGVKTNDVLIDNGIKSIFGFIPNSTPGKVYSAPNMSSDSLNENDGKSKTAKDVNISEETDLNKYSNDELLTEYNNILNSELSKKNEHLSDIMKRIALNLKQRGINAIGKEVDEDNLQKDISFIDKWFKVLSHFSDSFPEMKEFSKIWNSAYFAKMKESKAEKRTHDKLALEVIKERNKKLGIVTKENISRLLGQIISENRHNYFGFLDSGNGKLITLEEANKKGLSKEQIAYLKYTREMLAARQKIDTDIYEADMDVLRTDKSFIESYKTEGIINAVGSWLGSSALSNVKLNFTDPNTGKVSKMDFIDIQNTLSKYAEKGLKEKGQALLSLFKYTLKASKKRVKKGGEYLLDENGNLQSKFNRPIDERKSYSKDFYGALNQYIDDSSHIKHISPLVPIINSIEYLNSRDIFDADGNLIGEQKKNLTEWIDKWRKLHVLGQTEETQPELDKALKLLRFMTSGITMWFNVPANILNIAIGNYNNWRKENGETWLKGQKRLFGGTDRKADKQHGYGILNRYAADIVAKYSGVSNDIDSNPITTGKNILANLGFLGQSWGEYQIQASGLLGLMIDEDYNSFEYKTNKHGVEELVVKDSLTEEQKKALEERILANIDKVSDVQGKYSDKDKRNIMNNEIGKIALQFKVWLADAYRIRYGGEGSWNKQVLQGGFTELRKQMKDQGIWKSLTSNKPTQEAKDFMSNIKGLMATGLLMALVYQDDEDKEKSFTAKLFQKALSDVLFIFDPDNLKFTITKPVAAVKTIEKMINIGDHMFAFEADDFYKGNSEYGDKGDSKLQGDLIGLLPGKKLLTGASELLNGTE